ncbi:hypothetical protein GQ55_9G164300 [Panicum hallii var. hallii]|uniref:Uncharacterized protein n=1 Tax=Panicum hallii var. hallii TaxID=1504633 RepID=A0A2T7C3X4_9POAL|nr:hypothetical protein GQ55_9G164300 [Panicum hallii var. hallii]
MANNCLPHIFTIFIHDGGGVQAKAAAASPHSARRSATAEGRRPLSTASARLDQSIPSPCVSSPSSPYGQLDPPLLSAIQRRRRPSTPLQAQGSSHLSPPPPQALAPGLCSHPSPTSLQGSKSRAIAAIESTFQVCRMRRPRRCSAVLL